MARLKNHEAHVTAAIGQLLGAVASLIGSVEGAISAGQAVRGSSKKVGQAAGEVGHAVSAKGVKLANAIKASWAKYTPEERKARIAKMHAWRKAQKKGE